MIENLDKLFLNNSILQWLYAIAVAVIIVILIRLLQHFFVKRLSKLARQTSTQWDDVAVGLIERTKLWFVIVAGFYASTLLLVIPDNLRSVLSHVILITLFLQIGVWGLTIIATFHEFYRQRALKNNPAAVSSVNVVSLIVKFVLWSSILLLALNNLGINVTSLIAGLGIGGIAIALALQNILGDLFSSLSIVFDKPFIVGDFIIIGDFMGSVEYIGLKTTRVRSLSGEQLVFSNSDLLSSRIRNYGRMFERRVVFNIGVTYQTSREKLKSIPVIIKKIIEGKDKTRFDRSHFMSYGDYALKFETVYYILSPDYNNYMDVQQAIYFELHEQFEKEQIEFAYPTQTLYVSQEQETGTRHPR